MDRHRCPERDEKGHTMKTKVLGMTAVLIALFATAAAAATNVAAAVCCPCCCPLCK
jgi:hypothetical protein